MYLHELTQEQQTFAEDNHNLVYAFLREKKLRRDEFYDIIIFGYLQAVQKYLLRTDLRQQYDFSTIAWSAMECKLDQYFRAQSRPSRKVVTVSFVAMVCGGRLAETGTAPVPDLITEKLDAELTWVTIAASLTSDQTEVLRMRADGYTTREIASMRRSPMREIEDLFSSALESARGLCLV